MSERESRIYFPDPLGADGRYTLTGDQHHYLARVLRLKAGAELVVFAGSGGEEKSGNCSSEHTTIRNWLGGASQWNSGWPSVPVPPSMRVAYFSRELVCKLGLT